MPFAVGVVVSPVPLIAAIIISSSRGGRVKSLAFALGWFVGVLVLVSVFSLTGVREGDLPVFFHWVNLCLGLLL